MSQFMTIIPAEWTRVPDEVLNAMNSTYVLQWVRENNFGVLSEVMREHWADAPDGISEAVMLNNEILVIK
jgi:hypothetical protein